MGRNDRAAVSSESFSGEPGILKLSMSVWKWKDCAHIARRAVNGTLWTEAELGGSWKSDVLQLVVKPGVITTALHGLKPSTYHPKKKNYKIQFLRLRTLTFPVSPKSAPVAADGKVTLWYDWVELRCWIFHVLCLTSSCSGWWREKPGGRGQERML